MAMEVSTEVPCFRYLRSLWALELSWLRRPEDDSSCDPMVKRTSTVIIAEVLAFFKAAKALAADMQLIHVMAM